MELSCACGSTERRPRSRCPSRSACADGRKAPLAIESMGGENMGGESEAAWRGSPTPIVVDGAPGLEKALAAIRPDTAVQRCAAHKPRDPLARSPDRLREDISNDCTDRVYAQANGEVEAGRKALLRKRRLERKRRRRQPRGSRRPAPRLHALPAQPMGGRSEPRTRSSDGARRSSARSTRGTAPPRAETAAMPFRSPLASGQIAMRKVDGWRSLADKPHDPFIDLAA